MRALSPDPVAIIPDQCTLGDGPGSDERTGWLLRMAEEGRGIVSQPTSVIFGGPGRKLPFVTNARLDLPAQKLAAEPHAGDLIVFEAGVAVLPAPVFLET